MLTFLDAHTCHFYVGPPPPALPPMYFPSLYLTFSKVRGFVVHCLFQNRVVAVDVLFQSNVILKLQAILESEKQQTSLLLLNLPPSIDRFQVTSSLSKIQF